MEELKVIASHSKTDKRELYKCIMHLNYYTRNHVCSQIYVVIVIIGCKEKNGKKIDKLLKKTIEILSEIKNV